MFVVRLPVCRFIVFLFSIDYIALFSFSFFRLCSDIFHHTHSNTKHPCPCPTLVPILPDMYFPGLSAQNEASTAAGLLPPMNIQNLAALAAMTQPSMQAVSQPTAQLTNAAALLCKCIDANIHTPMLAYNKGSQRNQTTHQVRIPNVCLVWFRFDCGFGRVDVGWLDV